MWWRVFIPSYRFFDFVEFNLKLFVRKDNEWILLNAKPRQSWHSIFFNPQMNMYHALNNLLEKLALDIADSSDIQNELSYRLVREIIFDYGGPGVEFKLCQGSDEILISGNINL